jgi:hypothetical protein
MTIRILAILTFSLNLLVPILGCDNYKELSAEADTIVNMITANTPTNRDDLLSHLKHLRIRDSNQETSDKYDFGDLEEKYADFQQLYLDSVQCGIPSLLPFAQLCKSIYEDNHLDRQKTKVAVHLLFREVFQKLQDLTKIMRKSELQDKEFDERRKAFDIDKETDYFFWVHESLGGAQGLKFPSTWGQNFSLGLPLLGGELDPTHVH